MDRLPTIEERMARGESNPAILAAMTRAAKSLHGDLQSAKGSAEKAKGDYDTRKKELGPGLNAIIAKIDDIRADAARIMEAIGSPEAESLSADIRQITSDMVERLKEIPTHDNAKRTAVENTERLQRSISESLKKGVHDTVSGVQELLDTQTSKIPTLEQIESAVVDGTETLECDLEKVGKDLKSALREGLTAAKDGVLTANEAERLAKEANSRREAATEKTRVHIDSLVRALSEQSQMTIQVRDALRELALRTEVLEDAVEEGVRESEGAWNRLHGDLSAHLTTVATSEDVKGAKDAVEAQIDNLPKIDNLQMTRIETATNVSMETNDARFDAVDQDLSERPTRQECENMLKRVSDVNRDETIVNLNWSIKTCQRETVEAMKVATQAAFASSNERLVREGTAALRDLGTTVQDMAQSFQARTQELVEDKEQALARLRVEYEEKLGAKDHEIKLLNESLSDVRRTITAQDGLIFELQGVKMRNEIQLQEERISADAEKSKLRSELGLEHDRLRTATIDARQNKKELEDASQRLEEALIDIERQTIDKDQAVTEAEMANERADDLEAKVKTLSGEISALEETRSQHLDRIALLRRNQAAPDADQTNEISGLFCELAVQLWDLELDPIGPVEGDGFVAQLASKLAEAESVRRLKAFVDQVEDSKSRCLLDVCHLDEPKPLEGNDCDRHNDHCFKVFVDRNESGKKVVYFR